MPSSKSKRIYAFSLKYLFPIDERQHKSTAIIHRENENIQNYINEITANPNLSQKDKDVYINVLNKIKLSIPFLTNENYLEFETKKVP